MLGHVLWSDETLQLNKLYRLLLNVYTQYALLNMFYHRHVICNLHHHYCNTKRNADSRAALPV